MPIRQAEPFDQVTMAKIAAKAFFDDELFGQAIHTHRREFPEDMHLYWLKRLRKHWNKPYNHFLVSTTQNEDGTEVITGMAQWTRKGKRTDELEAADQGGDADEKLDLPENRAADPEMENLLERAYPFTPPMWKGPRHECWDLTWLAVDPAYQGQRHGAALVQYGLDLATKENVTASVISAWRKDRFYEKCGFTSTGVKAGDGEGNPLHICQGGLIMFKDD